MDWRSAPHSRLANFDFLYPGVPPWGEVEAGRFLPRAVAVEGETGAAGEEWAWARRAALINTSSTACTARGAGGAPLPAAGADRAPLPTAGDAGALLPAAGGRLPAAGVPLPANRAPLPAAGADRAPLPAAGDARAPLPAAGADRAPLPAAGDARAPAAVRSVLCTTRAARAACSSCCTAAAHSAGLATKIASNMRTPLPCRPANTACETSCTCSDVGGVGRGVPGGEGPGCAGAAVSLTGRMTGGSWCAAGAQDAGAPGS